MSRGINRGVNCGVNRVVNRAELCPLLLDLMRNFKLEQPESSNSTTFVYAEGGEVPLPAACDALDLLCNHLKFHRLLIVMFFG